ncbi:hypothetical protein Ahy_B06g082310 isoform B [Arachis hypogaea]|uniref:Uncharacterized protein n=1 Tax=Arachis hypogaea TaxID=3818 RepID=A0A444YN99_ARAHY|nr:hypothetical protein Ahy_B06g082310 isoform B [Arachis hypogaea]
MLQYTVQEISITITNQHDIFWSKPFTATAFEASVDESEEPEGASEAALTFFSGLLGAGASAGAAVGGAPKRAKGRSTWSTWYTASWLSL